MVVVVVGGGGKHRKQEELLKTRFAMWVQAAAVQKQQIEFDQCCLAHALHHALHCIDRACWTMVWGMLDISNMPEL